jgi:hydroxyethylthiazole kinase-like uncharacterized protein yjeF
MRQVTLQSIKKSFPKRKRSSHKRDFGRTTLLVGSKRLVGCGVLAAEAALRCGTGLLTVGFPKVLYNTYTRRLTEAMFLPLNQTAEGSLSKAALKEVRKVLKTQDVLGLGPGLTWNMSTQNFVKELLSRIQIPFVLDADGLYPFSKKAESLKKVKVPFIITPHEGEFRRLFGFSGGVTQVTRKQAALKAAKICGGVVALKGDRTIVASPGGHFYINRTGNAGLAKGGTGDVLFGMITSLLGQGIKPFQAASLGVYLHGLAADKAIKSKAKASLLATDVINSLPIVLKGFHK